MDLFKKYYEMNTEVVRGHYQSACLNFELRPWRTEVVICAPLVARYWERCGHWPLTSV